MIRQLFGCPQVCCKYNKNCLLVAIITRSMQMQIHFTGRFITCIMFLVVSDNEGKGLQITITLDKLFT
jgi:hypothetical protein